MNKQEQEKSFDAFAAKQKATICSKRSDYANEDVLSNFKRVGAMTGRTPAQACLSLIATKVARLTELLEGKSPKHESIEDTTLDLCCYGQLLNMILEEQEPKVPKSWADETTSYTDWLKKYGKPTQEQPYSFKAKSLDDAFDKLGGMGFTQLSDWKCCDTRNTPGLSSETFQVKFPKDLKTPQDVTPKKKVKNVGIQGKSAAEKYMKDMVKRLKDAGFSVAGSGYIEVK